MTRGTVIEYDPSAGSGYVEPDDDHERIPFDSKSLVDFKEGDFPAVGERVSFQVEGGMVGLWATHVRRID